MRRFLLILAAVVAALAPSPGLAADPVPHEDPDIAEMHFDGIAIFGYCAQLLETVLERDPDAASALSEKAPFANTPEDLIDTLAEFGGSGVDLARLVPLIETQIDDLAVLAAQFRLDEALSLRLEAQGNLNLAYRELLSSEQAARTFRTPLGVTSDAPGSPLALAYVEVENRTESIRALLDMLQGMLDGVPAFGETYLRPTETTFSLDDNFAFVGDYVSFRGMLTSYGVPLAGRTVEILLDGAPYAVARTGSDGSYNGFLRVPYRYVSTLSLRALYYPKASDIGVYLASRSDTVDLDVLFYTANLELQSIGKSYPGRDTLVTGFFDYGQGPAAFGREIFIYLDGKLIATDSAGQEIMVQTKLEPDMTVGPHSIVVIAPAQQRYAAVDGWVSLDVEQVKTMLKASHPRFAFQPASLDIEGSVFTEFGPAAGSIVEATFGNRSAPASTGEDGSFSLSINNDITFSLVGTERLTVSAIPAEPWNAPVSQSWTLVTVNPILIGQLGIFMGVLVALVRVRRNSILKKQIKTIGPRRTGPRKAPVVIGSDVEPALEAFTHTLPVAPPVTTPPPPNGVDAGADPVWTIYSGVVDAIARRTGQTMTADQTFREFESRVVPSLGSASEHLRQLNLLMEKRYYSLAQLAPAELEACRKLGRLITGSLQT